MGNNQRNIEEDKLKIKEKLRKELIESPNIYDDIKSMHQMEIEDFIFALSDVKTFKETFLIPHYKMYNLLLNINTKISELRQINLTKEEIEAQIKELEQIKLELSESKIEIYFCNAVGGNPRCLKCLANIAMTYGLTHTGLLVDDIVIQWGRGLLGFSLVNPWKNVKYNDYIFAIELQNEEIWSLIKETYSNLEDYITNKKPIDNMGTKKAFEIADSQLNSIAETSVEFNLNKKYHLVFENCNIC